MFSESLMRGKDFIQQGRKESIYRVYGGRAAGKGLRDENSHDRTGECGGYPCGSTADQ